jgi:hypothetical protein
MKNKDFSIKTKIIKDLPTDEFIEYLELSTPNDLDVFAQNSNAEVKIDQYGLPTNTIKGKPKMPEPRKLIY